MSTATPIVRQSGEGERMWFAGGGTFTWKATADETDGAYLMIEDEMVRGKTTPYHLHPNQDEAIYILEGELVIDMDGDQQEIGAGGLFVAPRGVPHAFLVTSETARVLALMVPGGGEDFYRQAGEPISSEAEASRPADFERLREAAQRSNSIEILGPPPFAAARPPSQPAVT